MNPDVASVATATKGWLSPEEGQSLYRLAVGVTGPIVEIGSYCGKSTIYLAAAAAETGNVVVAVDHHRGNPEMAAGLDCHDAEVIDPFTDTHDTLLHFRRTIRRAGFDNNVMAVVAPSAMAARFWAAPIGLLFIDGDHSYAGCHADYRAWAPSIQPGGTLVFHDVTIADIERVATEAASDGFIAVDDIGCMRVMRWPA